MKIRILRAFEKPSTTVYIGNKGSLQYIIVKNKTFEENDPIWINNYIIISIPFVRRAVIDIPNERINFPLKPWVQVIISCTFGTLVGISVILFYTEFENLVIANSILLTIYLFLLFNTEGRFQKKIRKEIRKAGFPEIW